MKFNNERAFAVIGIWLFVLLFGSYALAYSPVESGTVNIFVFVTLASGPILAILAGREGRAKIYRCTCGRSTERDDKFCIYCGGLIVEHL